MQNNYRSHVHDHTGITSCSREHSHIHPGITSTPIPDMNSRSHYHEIIGGTTYDHGHFHTYRARTGPSVTLPNGYHTHFARFSTSFNEGHSHEIEGFVTPTRYEQGCIYKAKEEKE